MCREKAEKKNSGQLRSVAVGNRGRKGAGGEAAENHRQGLSCRRGGWASTVRIQGEEPEPPCPASWSRPSDLVGSTLTACHQEWLAGKKRVLIRAGVGGIQRPPVEAKETETLNGSQKQICTIQTKPQTVKEQD